MRHGDDKRDLDEFITNLVRQLGGAIVTMLSRAPS
jgi:hypothetical protein